MTDELHIQLRRDTGYYRYVRRVPASVEPYISQRVVKRTLNTKDRTEAAAMALAIDAEMEELWDAILQAAEGADEWIRFEGYERIAEAMGFDPMPAKEIMAAGLDEVVARMLTINGREGDRILVDAVLGIYTSPQTKLSGLFRTYMKFKGSDLEGYSSSQLRRHTQSKERALQYLLQVVRDKPLDELTRRDALRFKAWWEKKIAADQLTPDSANRSFADIQGMLSVIDAALLTKHRELWSGLRIKGSRRKTERRPSFAPEFIQRKILAPGALDRIPLMPRLIFYSMIETGARPSELANLRPEDIRMGEKIPHLIIKETDERILKSGNATRTIPLVGVSLWAMRQAPNGFPQYRDNEDSLSAAINKGLDRAGLRPTKKHVAYSIRHSFQDRILAAGASDRLQTDLMGHEFERVKYGEGPSLKQKQALLEKIKFDWVAP